MESIAELTTLLKAARGERPADTVLKNAQVVNLFNGEIQRRDVALQNGLVAGVGKYQGENQIDLDGLYLCPGFMDGHLHIESTLLTPAQLSAAVCPRGTSAVVAGPHEIGNVMGMAGIKAMLTDSQDLPVTFYFNAPSCVPATGMETSGAVLDVAQLKEMAKLPRVLGLAEVMNFPGVVAGDPEVLEKLLAFSGRPMDGHAPLLSGKDLNAYLAAGPESDHECTRLEEAAEKLAKGMWVMIRQGSSARNLADLLPLVNPVTERRCMLVCDDRHPDDLAEKGHMDHLLRLAVDQGLDAISALRMASLNPARRFGLDRTGAIAPGWAADLAAVEDLRDFKVRLVFKAGELAAKDEKLLKPVVRDFAAAARDTMRLPRLSLETFQVPARGNRVRIMELVPGQILTKTLIEDATIANGFLVADPNRDLARISVIERHQASGRVGQGLVKGLKLRRGALAGSVAHDAHNLVVAGMDNASMLTAARRVGELGGGLAAALGDEVLGELPLPLAGLMSDRDLSGVLAELKGLRAAAGRICGLEDPFMPLSFLALEVIPQLKLTDLGLVDVDAFALTDLFVDGN